MISGTSSRDRRDDDLHPGARGHRLQRGLHLREHFRHRHRLERHRHAAGFDPRQVEHLVDQPQQVLAALEHLLDALAMALGQRLLLVALQQLREAEDRVERRAQLVAHRGQELALGGVRGLGQRARLAQLVLARPWLRSRPRWS